MAKHLAEAERVWRGDIAAEPKRKCAQIEVPAKRAARAGVTLRLQGKRAIVTGGGSGIGRAAALRLAEEGASVGVLDVNLDTAEQTAQSISEQGGQAIALKVNVADEAQVSDAVREVERRYGGLDTVIANAGIMLFGKDTIASDLDLETWQKCMDVNLTGMFLTCKHGLQALLRNGSGSVVITASPTGVLGCAPTFTAYSTSKAGTFRPHADTGYRLREEEYPRERGPSGHHELAAGHYPDGESGDARGVPRQSPHGAGGGW